MMYKVIINLICLRLLYSDVAYFYLHNDNRVFCVCGVEVNPNIRYDKTL